MRTEVFLLGFDYIFFNGILKVLEVQTIDECDYKLAEQITGVDPMRLMRILPEPLLRNRRLSLKIQQLQGDVLALAMAESEKEKFFNRYIEILCQQKWLFYAFCMQNRHLQRYIPQTIIATAPTFTAEILGSMKEFLFKPPSLSKGRGIIKMRLSDLDVSQRLHKYVVEYVSPNRHHPIILQEYLCDSENRSYPVCRVYAVATITLQEGKSPKIATSIDFKSVTLHRRNEQKEDDFTLVNNTNETHVTSEREQQLVREFLVNFCSQVFIGEKRCSTYQCWIGFAKQYIKTVEEGRQKLDRFCEPQAVNQRLAIISCFLAALEGERLYQVNIYLYEVMLMNFLLDDIRFRDIYLTQTIDQGFWNYFAGRIYMFISKGSVISKFNIVNDLLSLLIDKFIQWFSPRTDDGLVKEGMDILRQTISPPDSTLNKRYCAIKFSITDRLFFSCFTNVELEALSETSVGCYIGTTQYRCLK